MSVLRDNVDLGIKVVTVCIAAFGVWKYFQDRTDARLTDSKARALSYIDSYASSDFLPYRRNLFEFWISNGNVLSHMRKYGTSRSAYASFLTTAFQNYSNPKQLVESVYAMSDFYDQVLFCEEASLCESKILNAYLCPRAPAFSDTYEPIFASLGEMTGTADFGSSVKKVAEQCVKSEPSASSPFYLQLIRRFLPT